ADDGGRFDCRLCGAGWRRRGDPAISTQRFDVDIREGRHGAGADGAGAVERLSAHLPRHRRLSRPLFGTLGLGRSALYGLFLYAGAPFAFWPNAIAQSVLTVWLIVLTLRANGLGGRPWLALGIVAMLTVGTGLPWFTSQLMPDILFPAS